MFFRVHTMCFQCVGRTLSFRCGVQCIQRVSQLLHQRPAPCTCLIFRLSSFFPHGFFLLALHLQYSNRTLPLGGSSSNLLRSLICLNKWCSFQNFLPGIPIHLQPHQPMCPQPQLHHKRQHQKPVHSRCSNPFYILCHSRFTLHLCRGVVCYIHQ